MKKYKGRESKVSRVLSISTKWRFNGQLHARARLYEKLRTDYKLHRFGGPVRRASLDTVAREKTIPAVGTNRTLYFHSLQTHVIEGHPTFLVVHFLPAIK
jgi:hypothetical protein